MGLRCLAPAGGAAAVAAAPALAAQATPGVGATCILLSTLATATLAHYNAPAFRAELADARAPDADRRFAKAVGGAFAITTAINALVAVLGLLTFGAGRADIPGFVLNGYGSAKTLPVDALADTARVVVYFSFLTSLPFAFAGLKNGVTPKAWPTPAKKALALGLLAALGRAAFSITDAGFVVAFAGATLGSALTYVIPSLLLLKAKGPTLSKAEKLACKLVSAVGFAFMGVGGAVTAKAYFA